MKFFPLIYPASVVLVGCLVWLAAWASDPEKERAEVCKSLTEGSNPSTGSTLPTNFEQLIDEAGREKQKEIAA